MIGGLAIVGVGLLGGSLAKAARAAGLAREIVGVGREAARLAPAAADGTFDRVTTDLRDGVSGADLVVLAAPVAAIERLLEVVWAAAPDAALITDVGSTKRGIIAAAQRLGAGRARQFVGSHPMAGSEQSGYAAARPDLFRGATVIVTPIDGGEPRAVKAVTGLWEAVGAARVLVLDADAHDRAVAAVSHLPHLVACALVAAVARFNPTALDLAGRGFKDTTRIAAASSEVWEEIFLANRAELGAATREFSRALAELAELIDAADAGALRAALERIRTQRKALA